MWGRGPARATISRYQLFPAPLLSLLSPRNGVLIQGRNAFIMALSAAGVHDGFTYHAALGADEVIALRDGRGRLADGSGVVPGRPAGVAEVVGACIPPKVGVDAGGTACIVAQYACQGRCLCNWDELQSNAGVGG